MQLVSQWAFRHPLYARLLIIAIELINAAIGITLGANAWAEFFPKQPSASGYLQAGIIVLAGAIFCLRHWYYLRKSANTMSQWAKHGYIFALFVFNFLLYIVAGGIDAQRAQVFHPSGGVGGRSEIRYESRTGVGHSIHPLASSRIIKHKLKDDQPNLAHTRTGYVLLFILGLALAAGASALACNLACAGHGFAAVMLLLLSFGVLMGGIYFLDRAMDKNMKLHKDMTREERRRARRPFVRIFLGLVVALGILLVISAEN